MSWSNGRKVGKLLVLSLLVSACVQDPGALTGLKPKSNDSTRISSGMRYLSGCPTDYADSLDEIGAPIVPREQPVEDDGTRGFDAGVGSVGSAIIVDTLVNFLGLSLERARDKRNGQFIAATAQRGVEPLLGAEGNLLTPTGSDCLVVYRATVGDKSKPPTSVGSEGLEQNLLEALDLSHQPAFYLELTIDESIPGKRVLQMNHLQYGASSAWNPGSGRKTVTVAIGLGVGTAKTNDDTFSDVGEVYRLNLGRLTIGQVYGSDRTVASIADKTTGFGYNMAAVVTESDRPSLALEALIGAFDSNKGNLSDALKEALE